MWDLTQSRAASSNYGETTMSIACRITVLVYIVVATIATVEANEQPVKEQVYDATSNVKIKVRMEGPYTADVPLQIVCYFKYTAEGAARMRGAPVELDKELGGLIGSLRKRGEFAGDELETIVIIPPDNTIKAKRLLLIGLGDESSLSLERMECVGRVALREAVRIGASRVAFAPLIKDAGNNTLPAGDVETAVVRGVLLAYDTEKRLQNQGFTKPFSLESWEVEAGPTYYDETNLGVKKAIVQAKEAQIKRIPVPYSTINKK
jgi:hypothetical protein